MKSRQKERNRIFIFNLETDLDSYVLAAAHDWVDALSEQYENVEVYSTHVGRVELGANVKVSELGGGSFRFKVQNLFRQAKLIPRLWRFRRSAVVFHHMSSRTLAVLGLPIRAMGIPQAIWYSHSNADFSLRFGRRFANVIFSSTTKAIPLTGDKMTFIGHGIKISRKEPLEEKLASANRIGVVSLGRISRVKNIEELLLAINESDLQTTTVTLIGPESDPTYSMQLRQMAADFHIPLNLDGPKQHSEIHGELKRFKFIFSGTPMSVDKALLEGALAGCFVITSNPDGITLSGMDEVWKKLNINEPLSIQGQLSTLERITPELDSELRRILVNACTLRNDLNQTAQKIRSILSNNRSGTGA
jgi:hypothetical protein